MATSPDHPELQYVQARYFTEGRADGPPLWIVVHDMEAGESSTRAESTAAYFATMNDGRRVSSHYAVDNDSVVQCVRLADVAWTVGNRPGNFRGINWELAGFARQTRAEWLDEFGRAMFAQMVPYVRADAAKFGIPLQRRTVDELIARKPGITSHNDLRLAFGGTTHTDPGPAFPWDYFLELLNGGDDMSTAAEYAHNADTATNAIAEMAPSYKAFPTEPIAGTSEHPNNLATAITEIRNGVRTLIDRPPATVNLTPEDRAAIVADLMTALTPVIVAEVAKAGAEARDAVADLGEGGSQQVRADA